jgi:hypothetical protein
MRALLLCLIASIPHAIAGQASGVGDSVFRRLLRAPQTNAVRDSLWNLVGNASPERRDSLRRLVLGMSPLHSEKPLPKLTAGHMYFNDSNGDGHVRIRALGKDYGCDSALVEATLAAADTTEFTEWAPRRPRVGTQRARYSWRTVLHTERDG